MTPRRLRGENENAVSSLPHSLLGIFFYSDSSVSCLPYYGVLIRGVIPTANNSNIYIENVIENMLTCLSGWS